MFGVQWNLFWTYDHKSDTILSPTIWYSQFAINEYANNLWKIISLDMYCYGAEQPWLIHDIIILQLITNQEINLIWFLDCVKNINTKETFEFSFPRWYKNGLKIKSSYIRNVFL